MLYIYIKECNKLMESGRDQYIERKLNKIVKT